MSWIQSFQDVVDEIAAIMIIGAGLVLCCKDQYDNGWKLIMLGAGYLFGKGNPLRRRVEK